MDNINIYAVLAITLVGGIFPLLIVMMTAFTKISVVLMIVRQALGVQQTPPTILINALAMILTVYVMAPTFRDMYGAATDPRNNYSNIQGWERSLLEVAQPARGFLKKNSKPRDRQFFIDSAQKVWKDSRLAPPTENDFLVLVPAFLSAELTRAFEIGFLLYMPFVMVDFAVSSILLAMGMASMNATVISTPMKLLLFVILEGWNLLLQGLVLSYA